MIHTVAISGYRSLRNVVLPLGQLTVITGANGTGKSSVYRSLRLLAEIADDQIVSSLAREGGFSSVQWAGPEKISREMRSGDTPVQGTVRQGPIALKLGFADEAMTYAIDLGLPQEGGSLFSGDPAIKRELLWTGGKPTPARRIADRRGPGVQARGDDDAFAQITASLPAYESMVRHVTGPRAPWEVAHLRERMKSWTFYDHFRTDAHAPARLPQIGTRTMSLAADGADLAAAVQTIYEVGDGDALNTAIDHAFPGARLEVRAEGGLFTLHMHQHGMLRSLAVSELSDGTLRFLLLAAALLTPRPAPLTVFNEPEASLHSDVIPALAGLIARSSQNGQVITVSHNRALVTGLLGAGAELVELHKDTGETFATVSETPEWHWPPR